jgi:hypothetical protein
MRKQTHKFIFQFNTISSLVVESHTPPLNAPMASTVASTDKVEDRPSPTNFKLAQTAKLHSSTQGSTANAKVRESIYKSPKKVRFAMRGAQESSTAVSTRQAKKQEARTNAKS